MIRGRESPPHLHLVRLSHLENGVLREDTAKVCAGIDDAASSDDGARADDRIAADLSMISDHGAEFAQAGCQSLVALSHDDLLAVEPHVAQDHACAQVRLVTEDGIAHVVEVGDLTPVEEDTV